MEKEEIQSISGTDNKYLESRNISGELLGAMKAIEWAKLNNYNDITIFHDYEGIARWVNGSWEANKDCSREYKRFIEKYSQDVDIKFTKVKAHTGDKYNEKADQLAKDALNDIESNTLINKSDNDKNKTYTFKLITENWINYLINFLNNLNDINHKIKTEKSKNIHQFSRGTNDKITISVYNNGTLVIQGRPSQLYSETISFLGNSPDITINDINLANNEFYGVDNKTENFELLMKEAFPQSYDKIPDTIKKIILPSLVLRTKLIDVTDYSCYSFPALRALEGCIKHFLCLKDLIIGEKESFGKYFNNMKLKANTKKQIKDEILINELEIIYAYLKSNRHCMFHTNSILIETKILEKKEEADDIINNVIGLIENIFVKCAH